MYKTYTLDGTKTKSGKEFDCPTPHQRMEKPPHLTDENIEALNQSIK